MEGRKAVALEERNRGLPLAAVVMLMPLPVVAVGSASIVMLMVVGPFVLWVLSIRGWRPELQDADQLSPLHRRHEGCHGDLLGLLNEPVVWWRCLNWHLATGHLFLVGRDLDRV